MQKIKSAALALPALLLAGCAAALPAENTATIETAAAAAPQTLKVYTSASLAPAAQAYAEAQGVVLTLTDEAASADLLLTDHAPGGSLLDVTSDTLLAAAAARAGITENANALPLGRSLYGYWARADVLNALLGDGAAAALQTANWEEWSDFVETLSAWMAEPKAATVTLSGADYTLPDARPGSLTATGVFAAPLDRASGYTAALLAADGTYTADALTGPLNGVYSAVTLEWDHMAADGGEGIFRRAKLTDLLAEYGADTCNGLVLVPFKCQLDDSDLTAEDYNAEGLLNYPVLADVGSIAINAGTSADGLKAAKSAALWLYSNGAGEDALTETLGVVTPWNTAAGTTAVTAMQVQQVGTGILRSAGPVQLLRGGGVPGEGGALPDGPARRGAGHCSRRCPDCQRTDPAGQRKAHQGRAHRLCGWCIGRAGGGGVRRPQAFPRGTDSPGTGEVAHSARRGVGG